MSKVQVFERAMCCSTGVCGPNVDPVLVRFAGDLEWLKGQGVSVERNNLSQQPQAFAASELVRTTMKERGLRVLPLVIIDGQIAFEATYPTREEFAARLGLQVPSVDDELTVIQPNRCC
jgi:arsenite methyltransferase